ncbi:MAG: PKD domain-containing protein, partial [Bacteroidetes bacterium]|nr:PKD domain-containing protein [Bacteroidota bacterium]
DQQDNSCVLVQNVLVGRIMPPALHNITKINPLCHNSMDGEAMIEIKDGTPPYYYEFAIGGAIVHAGYDSVATGLQGGVYYVTVTDDDGCTVVTSFILTTPTPVNVYGHAMNNSICFGDSTVISATASGGTPMYTYTWNVPDFDSVQVQTVGPETTTTYFVSATDVNGCQSLMPAAIMVNVLPEFTFTINVLDDVVCEGDSAQMFAVIGFANGSVTYSWSTGSHHSGTWYEPSQDTTVVTLTAYDGCMKPVTANATVYMIPSPVISINAKDYAGCEPLYVIFSNNVQQDNVTYQWTFGDASSGSANTSQNSNPGHLFDHYGEYDITLELTDVINGCRNEVIMEDMIEVYENPDAEFIMDPPATASLFNATVNFGDISSGPVNYWYWDFGDSYTSFNQNPEHPYDRADTFTICLAVSTPHNCRDTVCNPFVVTPEYTFYAPTAFLPRSGTTDFIENCYWTPEGNGISVKPGDFNLYIFDRWGELIFKTDRFYDPLLNPDENCRWNGRVHNKGKIVPIGVYKWVATLYDVTGLEHTESGQVTVIR